MLNKTPQVWSSSPSLAQWCSLSGQTAPQPPAASQLSLLVAMTPRSTPALFLLFMFNFSLSLHLWLKSPSSPTVKTEFAICAFFLQKQCWGIWCPPEVDTGKCNYCGRGRHKHRPPPHFPARPLLNYLLQHFLNCMHHIKELRKEILKGC